jgi:hypothetical protein
MPAKRKCKETLQQVRERLVREQRLRKEKILRELLEPEQLAVTEDESESDNSESEDPEPEDLDTSRSTAAVSYQACLIFVICFALICLVCFLSWFESNFVCYRI